MSNGINCQQPVAVVGGGGGSHSISCVGFNCSITNLVVTDSFELAHGELKLPPAVSLTHSLPVPLVGYLAPLALLSCC